MANLKIAVHAELPSELLARIDQAAGTRVLRRGELAELDGVEILFVQRMDPLRIAQARSLRWVQTYGAGVEWLLVPEVIARADLVITNARIHAQPIAEHVFGWLLSYVRNLHKADRQARQQKWEVAPLRAGLGTLQGKTLGVMGLGVIGLRIAQLGAAFGMRVIAFRRNASSAPVGVEAVHTDLLEFLGASEFVINTLPATAATHHLLAAREFEAMRPGAFVVNVGRGSTLDTVALVDALNKGRLGGAALDVTDPEPLPSTHSLWKFDNVLITPHYAGSHPGYDEHATALFLDNLARYRAGEPLASVVDVKRGY